MLQRHDGTALVRELVPLMGFQGVANAWSTFILENAPYLKWDSCAKAICIRPGRDKVKFCTSNMELLLTISAYSHTRNPLVGTCGRNISPCAPIQTYTCVCERAQTSVCYWVCAPKQPSASSSTAAKVISRNCALQPRHLAWEKALTSSASVCSRQTLVKHN